MPATETASRRGVGGPLPSHQRLRLELRAADGRGSSFSADDILDAGPQGDQRASARLTAGLEGRLVDAEPVLDLHRTRLYLVPLDRSGNARGNGLLIEGRQTHADAAMIERIPLEVFCTVAGIRAPERCRPVTVPTWSSWRPVCRVCCSRWLRWPTARRARFVLRTFDAPVST